MQADASTGVGAQADSSPDVEAEAELLRARVAKLEEERENIAKLIAMLEFINVHSKDKVLSRLCRGHIGLTVVCHCDKWLLVTAGHIAILKRNILLSNQM